MKNKIQKLQQVMKCGVSVHIGRVLSIAILFNCFIYVAFIIDNPVSEPFINLFNELGYKFLILQMANSLLASSIMYLVTVGLIYLSIRITGRTQ